VDDHIGLWDCGGQRRTAEDRGGPWGTADDHCLMAVILNDMLIEMSGFHVLLKMMYYSYVIMCASHVEDSSYLI